MDKLKPCPFCGHEDASFLPPTCTRRDDYDSGDRAFPLLRCMGCYLDFPGPDWDFSGQIAARMWNARTESPELTAANARTAYLEQLAADRLVQMTADAERIAELETAVADAYRAIENDPAVTDTVWFSDTETLCDRLFRAIGEERAAALLEKK